MTVLASVRAVRHEVPPKRWGAEDGASACTEGASYQTHTLVQRNAGPIRTAAASLAVKFRIHGATLPAESVCESGVSRFAKELPESAQVAEKSELVLRERSNL